MSKNVEKLKKDSTTIFPSYRVEYFLYIYFVKTCWVHVHTCCTPVHVPHFPTYTACLRMYKRGTNLYTSCINGGKYQSCIRKCSKIFSPLKVFRPVDQYNAHSHPSQCDTTTSSVVGCQKQDHYKLF